MKEQHPAETDLSTPDTEEWLADESGENTEPEGIIYKKDSINPAKRRRLEAMREERELMDDIRDVFDEYPE